MVNIAGGSIQWKASIDNTAFNTSLQGMRKAISEFASSIKKLEGNTSSGNKALANLSSSASNAAGGLNSAGSAARGNATSIGAMTGAVAAGTAIYEGMTAALRTATGFLGDSVQSANRYQAALLGLGSVATAFGNDQKAATEAAKSLASDGLLTVSDAATGLKNLLATGFGLDESVALLTRFKDTAAFGRQAALGFGESIRGATEGVKNGNCLVAETPILIEGGEEVSIGELYKRGEPVRVYSLRPDGSMRHTPISHVINNGIKPVYRLKTNRGKSIRATGNHRFLTPDGWKMLDELSEGQEILSIDKDASQPIVIPHTASEVLSTEASGSKDEHVTIAYTLNRENIVSIESDGQEEVYDLSVPETRNFIASGLVVHNSILTDNAGITKNLSVILREAGKSEQDVMNITSDASVRQALFTGLMRESAAQVGDAAKLSDTYAGAQARAAAQTEVFKQNLGGVVQLITGGLLQSFTSFIGNNQTLIISFGAAALATAAVATGLFLVVKAINAFRVASILAVVSNPLLLFLTVLSVLAGVVVFKAVDKLQKKVAESNAKLADSGKAANSIVPGFGNASKAAKELAEKLAEIDQQIEKTKLNFREQLAEMVKSHQDKVKDIENQLAKENAAFAKSANEKKKLFEQEQSDAANIHEDRLIDIQKQIDRELASSHNANSLKLRDLQATLAKEKTTFGAQNATRKAKYEEDVANDQAARDEKITNLTTELDKEKELLQKHASDVASVRNVILLDEIDKLKRSNDEQLKSLEKQRQDTLTKSGETNAGLLSSTDKFLSDLQSKTGAASGAGSIIGSAIGKALKEALVQSIKELPKDILNFLSTPFQKVFDEVNKGQKNLSSRLNEAIKSLSTPQFIKDSFRAKGGPVAAGQQYTVGENGRELFVPAVAGTILPNSITEDIMGSRGTVINPVFNVYNQIDLTQGLRDLAWQLGN